MKKRYERISGSKDFHQIIDWKKDGQVIKIYKTKKACNNKVFDLNNKQHDDRNKAN